MAAGSHVIETTSLTKHYGSIVAVDGLSMSVPRGHVFGLLGPNGSGKTTTMSMLLGLVRPTAGGFSLFGSSDGLEEALHRVGAIIESPTFYPTSPEGKTSSTSRAYRDEARHRTSTACSKESAWRVGETTVSAPTLSA